MKEKFLTLCRENIHREGIDKLLAWLEKSDFFTAPASTRFHGAHEGGLVVFSVLWSIARRFMIDSMVLQNITQLTKRCIKTH